MFTGIITHIVNKVSWSNNILQVTNPIGTNDISVGDSISINGLCLTVILYNNNIIKFQVSDKSLEIIGQNYFNIRKYFNFEQSLKTGDKISGHFVYGHIDSKGIIKHIHNKNENLIIKIQIPAEFRQNVVYKGSIAVDGVSLTINNIDNSLIDVNVIKHTYNNTIFKHYRTGNKVLLEYDALGKYVLKDKK